MCLCSSIAPKKLEKYGIERLKCGSCPECLSERANAWVLRCVAEARSRRARGEKCCMVTLTYDQYLRDKKGDIIFDPRGVPLELPPDVKKLCNKRDVQLFMKRLRAKFGDGIKYLITAEHGKRTHRAHYHAILFGVEFSDALPYKKSSRGNQIFRSKTLEKLWKQGICTVDAVNIDGSMARYVTKYSMKQRGCDDTFQLFSHGIGVEWLIEHFTGRPYIIEGREYAIPRVVWNAYIMQKYGDAFPITDKYRSPEHPMYDVFQAARKLFVVVRNSDDLYAQYLMRQSARAKLFEELRSPDEMRVLSLDPSRYFGYRSAWFARMKQRGYVLDPNASPLKREHFIQRVSDERGREFGRPSMAHLPFASRHYTANDRFSESSKKIIKTFEKTLDKPMSLCYNDVVHQRC